MFFEQNPNVVSLPQYQQDKLSSIPPFDLEPAAHCNLRLIIDASGNVDVDNYAYDHYINVNSVTPTGVDDDGRGLYQIVVAYLPAPNDDDRLKPTISYEKTGTETVTVDEDGVVLGALRRGHIRHPSLAERGYLIIPWSDLDAEMQELYEASVVPLQQTAPPEPLKHLQAPLP